MLGEVGKQSGQQVLRTLDSPKVRGFWEVAHLCMVCVITKYARSCVPPIFSHNLLIPFIVYLSTLDLY